MKLLIALSVLLGLGSCAIVPPNVPVFIELNEHKAAYTYTMSGSSGIVDDSLNTFFDERFMTKPRKWSEIKSNSVILPDFSYHEINKYISKKEIKK
jgi:hypothetical protein